MRLAGCAAVYLCVATVISQTIALAYLWRRGGLDRQRLSQIVSIVRADETIPVHMVVGRQPSERQSPEVPFEEILQRRAATSLDLDLREQAVAHGLSHLRRLADHVAEDTRRFDFQKEAFNESLARLEEQANGTAMAELSRTLGAMRPAQAKDQLIRLLEDDQTDVVVTLLKAMPLDRKKRLLAEFKAGDEPERLAEILREILQSAPHMSLIKASRGQLSGPPTE
jgi:hypothetical protein